MQYFERKLSAAQLEVAGLVGGIQRSFQGALGLVLGTAEDQPDKDNQDEEGGNHRGRLRKAFLPLRSFARHSRKSLRRFSIRRRQTAQKGSTDTSSETVQSYGEDTDALLDSESDTANTTYEWRSRTDRTLIEPSPKPSIDALPKVLHDEVDPTEPELFPFPETFTPLLDTSAQKFRADLAKTHRRSRPSRARPTLPESQDWRSRDTTDGEQKESDSEEEEPPNQRTVSTPPSSRKVAVFPGISPLSLIAQMKKRAEGRDQTEEDKESLNDQAEPSAPVPMPRSPRPRAPLAGAALVLPPLGGTDGGAVPSPSWLMELKSKKRVSQHEGE